MPSGAALLSAMLSLAACRGVSPEEEAPLPGRDPVPQDTAPKAAPRLLPPEVYLRTYLTIFGGLSPEGVAAELRGGALFDAWSDYLSSLGLPSYAAEIGRATQTNSLMLATFERLGVALCDRAAEHDLRASPPRPLAERRVFAFELPGRALDAAGFAGRFDVLHRTFLGYPAALAPDGRVERFFGLYEDTLARRSAAGAPASRFSPAEAAWAAVCYGLVRHPEFHTY
jgi:hypothetical protein